MVATVILLSLVRFTQFSRQATAPEVPRRVVLGRLGSLSSSKSEVREHT